MSKKSIIDLRVFQGCFGSFGLAKGKPWDINEVRQLKHLVDEGKGIDETSQIMMKTLDAIRQKVFDLDLKIKVQRKEQQQVISGKKTCFCSSQLKIPVPADLPTIEEALQILGAALIKGAEFGLDKDEVQRLQVVATLTKTYKEAFADYLDYRGHEERLVELEAKYDELIKKAQTHAPS